MPFPMKQPFFIDSNHDEWLAPYPLHKNEHSTQRNHFFTHAATTMQRDDTETLNPHQKLEGLATFISQKSHFL